MVDSIVNPMVDPMVIPMVITMVIRMVVPMVDLLILSKIKYERRLSCFDFGMKKSLWLPRCCCFGYEKEREREREGEGKWMALFRDFFFFVCFPLTFLKCFFYIGPI